MRTASQTVKLLTDLTRKTVQGELQWHATDAPRALQGGTNDVYPSYYETRYKGQAIGIAQRRYKDYDGDRDIFHWNEEIVVVFLDINDRIIWEEREQWSALRDLFLSVRSQSSDLDGIFNRLLNDDEN